LQAVEQEETLADSIKIDQLRQANESLLSISANTEAIRQAIEQVSKGRGNISVQSKLQAANIVTGGTQHIINIYQSGGGAWSPADYQAALDRYLEWVSAAMGRVVLSGIKRGGQQAIELSLQEVYIPLAAEALPEAREQLKRGLAHTQTTADAPELITAAVTAERISLKDLLAQGQRLAVIGGPGCGKTTVIQHIAWTLAEALRQNQPQLAAERLGLTDDLPLPIMVPLSLYADHRRRFADHADPQQRQLATFINHYLIERQAGLNLVDDFFATLLNQGRHIILLLDGLDEVPNEAERALVSQAVKDLTHGRPHVRVVITSRTRAYQGKAILSGDFRMVRVLDLAPEQVADLIRQAYQAIFPAEVEKDERDRRAANLIDSVTDLEADRATRLGENRLVTTPLMVRMLLIVHFNLRRLPDQRAELYMEVVDTLLTSSHNPDEAVAQQLAQLGGDWRTRRDMLQYLAFTTHSRGQDAGREIEERALTDLLCQYLADRRHKTPEAAALLVDDFVSVSRQRGSLLEERAGRHRFSHLSFQEFLTARYLAEVEREVSRIVDFVEAEARANDSWWREPVLLVMGYLHITTPDTAVALIQQLAELDDDQPAYTALALAKTELAATAFLEWGGSKTTRQALAQRLVNLITDTTLTGASPPLRAAAGRVLARLGDPRPGVTVIVEETGHPAWPDFVWCKVPAGPFLLGANDDEKDAYADERPQHELTLPTFYIARYPVTNAQFDPFIKAGGYDDLQWWTEAGWEWRKGIDPDLNQLPDEDLRKQYADWLANRPAEQRHQPYWWQDERLNLPNLPLVGVNWYETMAYCRWVTHEFQVSNMEFRVWRDGQIETQRLKPDNEIRLPTEAEWEKAAGWDPTANRKRVYAWGDEWDETKANVGEVIGLPSPAGIFPAGAASCGALDITGNVWEWMKSSWGSFDYNNPGFQYPFKDARPQTTSGQREGLDTPGFRALRGGSWPGNGRSARVSARYSYRPVGFGDSFGFRLVVAPVFP
ncbi:MAG: SUMF1/EgtB/PvdO family nonheme iron enzyme, partial [Gammaproteobacteria bacterium]|nr:SUMF1/EgtB/PvdO family nonheme iron enzyme [Gammaproteobacteria bacterium]